MERRQTEREEGMEALINAAQPGMEGGGGVRGVGGGVQAAGM